MKHFVLMALVLATCNLLAYPARKDAATANNMVLLIEFVPCDGPNVVFLDDFNNNIDGYSVGSLTASINMFIPISGQSIAAPGFPSATIKDDKETAARLVSETALASPASHRLPWLQKSTAIISRPRQAWGLMTETALMPPVAG